jgi:hypothetical protein
MVRTPGFQPENRGSTPLRATKPQNWGNKIQDHEEEIFYSACAEILGIEHQYRAPPSRRNRWNTHRIGNGRYPGFGLIRAYGQTVIIIAKTGTKSFENREVALEHLRQLKRKP